VLSTLAKNSGSFSLLSPNVSTSFDVSFIAPSSSRLAVIRTDWTMPFAFTILDKGDGTTLIDCPETVSFYFLSLSIFSPFFILLFFCSRFLEVALSTAQSLLENLPLLNTLALSGIRPPLRVKPLSLLSQPLATDLPLL
jgi:hypothetical protein